MLMEKVIGMLVLGTAALTVVSSVAEAGTAAQTMRVMAIERTGGPDVLEVHDVPVPQPGADEILIAVHTASVASWDAGIRERLMYVSKPRFPFVMGSDGAGVVAAVGSAVKTFKVGDAVYGYCWDNPKGGFYAEYVAVPTTCVARLPKGVTLDNAGALGASGLTALQGIDGALGVKPGETLIIHGASGAVGTLAIQIARLRGARILATASGDDGMALVRRLGAEAAVDGRRGDIEATARSFAPQGVDAVLALAAGDGLESCLRALRRGGRLAFPHGIASEPQPRDGITIIPYDAISEPQELQLARLNQAVEAHPFEIPIAAEFPLADAAKAHERLAAGHVLGKILLRVR